jgi:multicomponent Na+:H+ antiporter subunit D
MISQGAADEHMAIVWLLLAAASAGVFLHAGIKFPWFVFFQKDSGLRPDDPPWNMRAAMILFSVLCIGLGIAPTPLYALLPYPVDFVPYTPSHVVFQLQLLLFSGLAFFLMLGWLKRTLTITLDSDWLWRKAGAAFFVAADRGADAAWRFATQWLLLGVRAFSARLSDHHGPEGVFGRTWRTGSMAFWMTLMLGAYLLLSYAA